jgi:ParB-like chromosome segregation protein Spo0J
MTTTNIVNKTISMDLLKPHPENYRRHPDEQIKKLCKSYRRFGQFRSIVAVPSSHGYYLIVAGHGFVEAMKREGATDVRVEVLSGDTDDEIIKGIMLADNLHSQGASDDEEVLAKLLEEQKNAGFDLETLGTDDETLRQMLSTIADNYLENQDQGDEEDKAPTVQFKEYDESIEDDLDTEICKDCGKLCLKSGKGKKK